MTVPHHSEPAREAVARAIHLNAITALPDEVWGLLNKLPPEELRVIFARLAAGALSTSPAPAAGELEAVLTMALQALEHSKPVMAHYEEPVARHKAALEAVKGALASPAATSAETQGGDGVREAAELLSHLKLYVLEKLDQHDADALHDRMNDLTAALAPSTSAATTGEPVAWACEADIKALTDGGADVSLARTALPQYGMKMPLYTAPPAPAVESAQVKVKPLEWGEAYGYAARAETTIGVYAIEYFAGQAQAYRLSLGMDRLSSHATLAAAQAAAQADYEARIRASLATDAEG